jgi:sporulation protein YlmC with PRC-barrel domain
MLQQMMRDLKGHTVLAIDGRVGSVQDVYFDDERWGIRYLVVDTREWWLGGKVLISPASVPAQQGGGDTLRVSLTREQVKNAPWIDEEHPSSRLQEAAYARYYGSPYYWAGPYLWGVAAAPLAASGLAQAAPEDAPDRPAEAQKTAARRAQKSHLRSGEEVIGYRIEAMNGSIGHVEDFVFDDQTWAIKYMVVDTRNWLSGRKVLVRPHEIDGIDGLRRRVRVSLKREQLEQALQAA